MRGTRGFTLLEIIVSIALMALVALTLFSALGYGVSAYVFTEQRVAEAQQARVALSRMRRELMEMHGVDASSDQDTLVYTDKDGLQATLTRSGSTVTYDGHLLMNNLATYTGNEHLFAYAKENGSTWSPSTDDFADLAIITVSLKTSSGDTTMDYGTTISPRNTDAPDGPIMLSDD